jgi:hypothetical protein
MSCGQNALASRKRKHTRNTFFRHNVYMASMEARVVSRSFLLPSFDIWRKASTP